MRITSRVAAVATTLAVAAGATALAAPSASAGSMGDTPLAAVLLADDSGFDDKIWDYDVVTAAALAVLTAKPSSDVGLLTDGDVALTAFLPRDRAFIRLVEDLTGTAPANEEEAFNVVASLGIDTVETVLLYHVVPGMTIDSATALGADGAELTTAAEGLTFTVDVRNRPNGSFGIRLVDNDHDLRNPWVAKTQLDINAGNKQIAHGISRVLIPVDL
jgi:hypothetical protein